MTLLQRSQKAFLKFLFSFSTKTLVHRVPVGFTSVSFRSSLGCSGLTLRCHFVNRVAAPTNDMQTIQK